VKVYSKEVRGDVRDWMLYHNTVLHLQRKMRRWTGDSQLRLLNSAQQSHTLRGNTRLYGS